MRQEEGLIDFDMFAPYHLSISTSCIDDEQSKDDSVFIRGDCQRS